MAIAISALHIKKLGSIQAGFASPVDEELADILHVDEYLIRDKDASFILEMESDSMIEHGICRGDLIIFERGADAKSGDLVVVLDENGYKLNFLSKRAIGNDQIVGLVISIMRKYK